MAFVAAVPYIMAIASAAAAAASAMAAQAQAKSSQNMANFNAEVAKNNATATRQQTDANEDMQRRQAAIALGRERSGIAQSGQGLDGTGADIYQQSTGNAELDALNIRYMGNLKAQGLDTESTLQTSQASQYGKNANAAVIGGALNAGSAALSGYSQGLQTQRYLPLGRNG